MKRNIYTLLLLLVSLWTSADNSKLSPWLRTMMTSQQHTTRRATISPDMLTTVFVQTSQTMTDDLLAPYGGKVYAQLGDIAIVTLPLGQLDALAELSTVSRIEANQLAHPTMDVAAQAVNILPVYQQTADHQAYTGRGVVVGVMDIGFDLTHPTFYNDASLSQYRIKAFWDQLAPNSDKSRFPVGYEYTTQEDILAKGCATDGKDQRHGTHTTGIAAGSGYDSPYRGMAFESDLCLVANAVSADTLFIDPQDLALYTSATDALGFKYLFDYAEGQQKPCVVSFSEGYTPYMDEDDLLFSTFLSRLTGPGRILVVSAGNENQAMTFVDKPQGTASAGAFIRTSRDRAAYRLRTNAMTQLALHAYPTGQPLSKTFELSLDDGQPMKPLIDTLFIDKDTCAIQISRYASAFGDGRTVYQIELTANKKFGELPHIALATTGSDSHTQLYGSSSNAFENYSTDPQWNDATFGHNVLAPGCFETPITVGSTSHRLSYTNMSGEVIENKSDQAGQLSWFSSTGPTLDGRTKPDVTAPGSYVISSYSSYYLQAHPDNTGSDVSHFDVNGRTYVWSADLGTSMSAPVVAGIIALWLEAKPDLTRDDIMGVLQRTSRQPESDLTYPNNLYGYGLIDAHRGLLDIMGLSSIQAISQEEAQGVTIKLSQHGQLLLTFARPLTNDITVTLYTTGGTAVSRTTIQQGTTQSTLSLTTLAGGIYAVQLTGAQEVAGSKLIRYQGQ